MNPLSARRLLFAPGPRITVQDFEVPAPGPNQVRIRISHSHVSAGSEMNFLRFGPAGYGINAPAGTALPIGYQSVGRIEALGPGVTGWKVGDRVVTGSVHCNGTLADLTNPNLVLDPVPEGVTDIAAGFAPLADVSLHSIRRAHLQIDESVAVFGMGLVGQMVLQFARAAGAHPLIAVDLSDARLAKARECGATHLVHAGRENAVQRIREITGGAGAETVIHCTQVAKILQQLLECAADRGKVVLTGSAPGGAQISLQEDLLRREISLIGTYERGLATPHAYWPWTRRRNRLASLRMMAAGTLKLEPLVTHVLAPEQTQSIFETMLRENESWLGVVIKWE